MITRLKDQGYLPDSDDRDEKIQYGPGRLVTMKTPSNDNDLLEQQAQQAIESAKQMKSLLDSLGLISSKKKNKKLESVGKVANMGVLLQELQREIVATQSIENSSKKQAQLPKKLQALQKKIKQIRKKLGFEIAGLEPKLRKFLFKELRTLQPKSISSLLAMGAIDKRMLGKSKDQAPQAKPATVSSDKITANAPLKPKKSAKRISAIDGPKPGSRPPKPARVTERLFIGSEPMVPSSDVAIVEKASPKLADISNRVFTTEDLQEMAQVLEIARNSLKHQNLPDNLQKEAAVLIDQAELSYNDGCYKRARLVLLSLIELQKRMQRILDDQKMRAEERLQEQRQAVVLKLLPYLRVKLDQKNDMLIAKGKKVPTVMLALKNLLGQLQGKMANMDQRTLTATVDELVNLAHKAKIKLTGELVALVRETKSAVSESKNRASKSVKSSSAST